MFFLQQPGSVRFTLQDQMDEHDGKTYSEELAEWLKGREARKPRQDKHVVAFLAVKSDVQTALDAGYAMKTIWGAHEGNQPAALPV